MPLSAARPCKRPAAQVCDHGHHLSSGCGQLLVLSLYRMYKEQGKSFVPKYMALLEAGGSDSPEALLKPLGVDIHDPKFWQKGFDEIQNLVQRVEKLADKIN